MSRYRMTLQNIPTRDLRAEIEAARWLAIDLAGTNRQVAEIQLEGLVAELERRHRLLARNPGDPLAPAWPARDRDLQARVEAVKAAWPLDRFCTELLGCRLQRLRNYARSSCPLPGHDDTTPSFVLYPDGHAWCFGCQRGGDVIGLTGHVFGLERFYDKLERLEQETGLPVGRSA